MRKLEIVIYVGIVLYIGICMMILGFRFTVDEIELLRDYNNNLQYRLPYILVQSLTVDDNNNNN